MNIIYKDDGKKYITCSISNIPKGSLFKYKGELLLRIEDVEDRLTDEFIMAFSLEDGEPWTFEEDEEVLIYAGDIILDPTKFQNYL